MSWMTLSESKTADRSLNGKWRLMSSAAFRVILSLLFRFPFVPLSLRFLALRHQIASLLFLLLLSLELPRSRFAAESEI
jgi:hypothetical protein